MSDIVEQPGEVDAGVKATRDVGVSLVVPAAAVVPEVPQVPAVAAPVTDAPQRPQRKGRSEEDVAYWRAVVDEWNTLLEEARRAGGLLPSIRGFCRDRKLRETSFYWWRRELAIRDGVALPTKRSADSTRVAGHEGTHRAATSQGAFVQLRVRPTPATGTLCEIVAGKLVLRVPPGFDANELSRLLDVLHAR